MLRRNGYVLEQLYSPLIVHTTPEHDELKAIAHGCVTRHHAGHYLGFAETQWRLFEKDRRIKPLLYTYRVLLTGIHLMRTGQVEANLRVLNDQARLSHVYDLIASKKNGREDELFGAENAPANADSPTGRDFAFHESEYRRLTAELEAARAASSLPHEPTARDALHDLLVRLRLK
jgi:predicted nucleotidyltransferase